jgi:transcriptional regulator with XRE-family HTH domain
MKIDTELYSTIRHLREMRKISRESISKELGMSVSGYSKIERGEIDIQISKLYKVAKILDIEITQLLKFKVSAVFNFNNSKKSNNLQMDSVQPTMQIQNNIYLEKYVKVLETEVVRLKNFERVIIERN